jgi:hypothetical protein
VCNDEHRLLEHTPLHAGGLGAHFPEFCACGLSRAGHLFDMPLRFHGTVQIHVDL